MELEAALQKYAKRGILVDTNILLLYVVGSFDPKLVPNFKRTQQFTVEDFELVIRLFESFAKIVTTPNILTEVNSLAGQLGEPAKRKCLVNFGIRIESLDEQHTPSSELANAAQWPEVGLTDCGILRTAKGKYLVLTDDWRLAGLSEKLGVDAVNFNHLRQHQWRLS